MSFFAGSSFLNMEKLFYKIQKKIKIVKKKLVQLCGYRLRTILMQFEAKGVPYASEYYKKVYMGFTGRVYKSCNTILLYKPLKTNGLLKYFNDIIVLNFFYE